MAWSRFHENRFYYRISSRIISMKWRLVVAGEGCLMQKYQCSSYFIGVLRSERYTSRCVAVRQIDSLFSIWKIAYNVRILSKERHRHRHRRLRLTRNHTSKASEQFSYNSTRNPTSAVLRQVSEISQQTISYICNLEQKTNLK